MLNFPPYYAWLFNQIWSRKRCFFLNIVFPWADTFDIQKPSMKQNNKKSAKSNILTRVCCFSQYCERAVVVRFCVLTMFIILVMNWGCFLQEEQIDLELEDIYQPVSL